MGLRPSNRSPLIELSNSLCEVAEYRFVEWHCTQRHWSASMNYCRRTHTSSRTSAEAHLQAGTCTLDMHSAHASLGYPGPKQKQSGYLHDEEFPGRGRMQSRTVLRDIVNTASEIEVSGFQMKWNERGCHLMEVAELPHFCLNTQPWTGTVSLPV
jgi:hypothetical protein